MALDHASPLVLNATTATGTGWTNPSNVIATGDAAYASTSTDQVYIAMGLANTTFTGTITKVTLKVDQSQVNANGDRWTFFLYDATCGTITLSNGNPLTTSARTTLSTDGTCPGGWTWLKINNLAAFVATTKSGGLDGEYRVYGAWLEVTFTNNAPVANAGPDQTVPETTLVALTAASSTDPDGVRDPLTYAWTQTGGTSVTLTGAQTATPTFMAPTLSSATPSVLTFQVTVTDPNLDVSTDDVVITVENTNGLPVANAGPDQTVAESALVTLTGTGSTDPDGDTLTYAWAQTAGTTVTLSSATSSQPTFTAPTVPTQEPVTLTFSLIVHDGIGPSTPDTVTITVSNVNVAPSANAGPDQSVDEAALVTLAGSGADPDGDSITYAWSQSSGQAVTLSSTNAATPTFTAPTLPTNTPVVLVFQLTTSDSLLSSPVDSVTITVNNVNQAPIAVAGADQVVEEQADITLDASDTADPDLDDITYAWTQVGGTTVTLTDANTARATFRTPVLPSGAVVLEFQVVATDALGATSQDRVNITVEHENVAPIAQAGADQNVDESGTVQLSGSASNDAEGDTLSFAWTQTSGPTVTITGANAATASFTAPTLATNAPVTLVFQLIVGDGIAFSAPDSVTIVVENINQAPVSAAGPDQTVLEGAAVALSGAGSTDADTDPLTYSWVQSSGPAVLLTTSSGSAAASFTAPTLPTNAPATLVFQLIVNDGELASAADTVTITVNNINTAPTIDAGVDRAVDEYASVVLTASAIDDDNDALSIAWEQVEGPAVTLTGADTLTVSFTAPTLSTNEDVGLRFRGSASDGIAAATVDEILVTVQNINQAPLASAGAAIAATEETVVQLAGTATDPDADPMTYTWTQVNGTSVSLDDASSLTPSFTAPSLDMNVDLVLEFRLLVSDGDMSSAPSSVVVTVRNVNRVPVASAGADQLVDSGGLVVLDASLSSDPDGDALQYAWTQTFGPTVTLNGADAERPTFTAPTGPTTLVFSVAVSDSEGATANPVTAIVYVNAPTPAPITETIVVTQTVPTTETVEVTHTVPTTQTVFATQTIPITETVSTTETTSVTETQTTTATVTATSTQSTTATVTATETQTTTATATATETVTATTTAATTDTVTQTVTAPADTTPTVTVVTTAVSTRVVSVGGGGGTVVTETVTTSTPSLVRIVATPSGAILRAGERIPVSVVMVPENGAAASLASGTCTWDTSSAGGMFEWGATSCEGFFVAGNVPGQDYELRVDVAIPGSAGLSLTIPIVNGLTMTPNANLTGAYDLALPFVAGGERVPVSFPSEHELDMVLLFPETNVTSGARFETLRLAGLPGAPIPGALTEPAFVLEINLIGPADAERPPIKASVQFSIDRTWLDEKCPAATCQIQMFHFSSDEWSALETTRLTESSEEIQYLAPTDSFSVFAAVGVAAAVPPTAAQPAGLAPWILILGLIAVALLISVGTATMMVQRRRRAEPTSHVDAQVGRRFGDLIRSARHEEVIQFVNSAAHDLASPLTTLNIQLHLLLRADPENLTPQQKKSFAAMGRNLEQLRMLVNDLKDAARQHAGQLRITPVPTDLTSVIDEIALEYGERAERGGCVLRHARPDVLQVNVDPLRIRQALGNLLDNALRFSPPGGVVDLDVVDLGSDFEIRVKDQGLGLSADQKARLFTPFVQVHEGDVKRQGTGLGLFICKGIVEGHGGRIWVESPGVGKGATFLVRLPRDGLRK